MNIQQKIEKILELSKADEVVVLARESSSANLRWANNTSTTNGLQKGTGLSIVSIISGSVGSINATYFPDDSLEKLVRESEDACEGKPKAQEYMPLPDGKSSGNWDDGSQPIDLDRFEGVVTDLAEAFKKARSDEVLLFGYASENSVTSWVATSKGFRGRHSTSDAGFSMTLKTPDFKVSQAHSKQLGSMSEADVGEMHERLMKRLDWSKNVLAFDPGHYPVILEPQAVGEILYYLYSQLGLKGAEEGRTALGKSGGGSRVGEKMFPEFINLYSDPAAPGLETPPFVASTSPGARSSVFDSGLPLSRTDLVKDGTLENLLASRFWAEKFGRQPVPEVGNLILEGNESKSLEDLISSTERALLVTRFWYTRMLDPQTLLLTGLTRDGVFSIEDGEVKGAVNNFRYNMSPLKVLAQTTELGASARAFGRSRVPHLRVDDFHMSSVSEAT
jgi:predicted Zn-dependent protease